MSLQISILGMLWKRESHPYEIKKLLQHFDIDKFVSITDGALYYNFDALMKKGYIEQVEVIQSDNRPDKTTYVITDKGREGLKDEIYKSFKKNTDIKSFSSVIPFLHLVDRDRIVYLIEDIIDKLNKRLEYFDENRNKFPELADREELHFMVNYSEQHLRTEIEWFHKLIDLVKQI